MRLQEKLERARNELSLLEEEIRIKDARIGHLDAHRRPHYRPMERLAVLELKAARGWSAAKTAQAFMVEPDTVAGWMKRADEKGPSALAQTREPVNRFPAFVRHLVRRLKALCPTMGKKRIAQTVAPTSAGFWAAWLPFTLPQAWSTRRQASRLGIVLRFHEGARLLPIVELKRVA